MFPVDLIIPLGDASVDVVIVDRIMSVSFIASLPEDAQNTVRDKVREVIEGVPALVGRDVVSFPYRTTAYYCEKV